MSVVPLVNSVRAGLSYFGATIMIKGDVLGGYSEPFYLIPSAVALAGLWRVALGVFSS